MLERDGLKVCRPTQHRLFLPNQGQPHSAFVFKQHTCKEGLIKPAHSLSVQDAAKQQQPFFRQTNCSSHDSVRLLVNFECLKMFELKSLNTKDYILISLIVPKHPFYVPCFV